MVSATQKTGSWIEDKKNETDNLPIGMSLHCVIKFGFCAHQFLFSFFNQRIHFVIYWSASHIEMGISTRSNLGFQSGHTQKCMFSRFFWIWVNSNSWGQKALAVPLPPRFFQSYAVFRQFWVNFGLSAPWGKNSAANSTKILDPPLTLSVTWEPKPEGNSTRQNSTSTSTQRQNFGCCSKAYSSFFELWQWKQKEVITCTRARSLAPPAQNRGLSHQEKSLQK